MRLRNQSLGLYTKINKQGKKKKKNSLFENMSQVNALHKKVMSFIHSANLGSYVLAFYCRHLGYNCEQNGPSTCSQET